MLTVAIREYKNDLTAKLEQHFSALHRRHDTHDKDFQRVSGQLAELIATFDNPRVAPRKESLINFPNTAKKILARDREARELLEAMRSTGPGIVSITAPPGFGKSAVFALALRMALPNSDPRDAGLDGIAVLDAKAAVPRIASFAKLLGRQRATTTR